MPRRKRLTTPKRTRKPSKVPDIPDDQWHEIKGILDERRRSGRTEYLVDWEPNAVTGDTYDPSWQVEVTEDALSEWKAKKAGAYSSSPLPSSKLRETEPESQESQPPRPANWRSLGRSVAAQKHKRKQSATEESPEASRKKQKSDRAISPSDGRAPSITTASSAVSLSGSPPPSQQVYTISDEDKQVAVVLTKNPDFDPTDFHSVVGTNTQTTAFSSQSLSQLESQDTQLHLTSTPRNSRQTVPDSQELLESSLSQVASNESLSSRQGPVQRVVADSQAESQPLTDTELSLAQQSIAAQDVSSRYPTGPGTQIPSGQGLSQSHKRSYDPVRDSLSTRQSDDLAVVYQSQPPFTPFPDSLASSGHLATETPSQIAALSLPHGEQPEHESQHYAERQNPFSSHLSQAAQVTRGEFDPPLDKDNLTQSPRQKSGLSAGFQPFTNTSTQGEQSQSAHRSRVSLSECLARPYSSETMDNSQGLHNPASRPSAEEELNKILDLSAAGPPSSRPSVQAELDSIFTFDVDPPPSLSAIPEAEKRDELSGRDASDNESAPFAQAEVTIQSQPRTMSDGPSAHGQQLDSISQITYNPQSGAPSGGDISGTLRAELPADGHLPGTISPADILRPSEGLMMGSIPELVEDFNSSRQPPPMGQTETEMDQATPDDSLAGRESRDVLVTLPFQASARDEYMDRLIREKVPIQLYSRHFTEEDMEDPADSLVSQIDDLFRALQNICDFPPDLIGTSLEGLDAKSKTKYARDANGKFSFIYELLQGITVDTKVVIVARSTELLRLIYCVTEALEIECICEALQIRESAFKDSAAVVRLALPSEDVPITDIDVIIGFDNSLTSSTLLKQSKSASANAPLILRLVTTHGMDHIDFKVDHDIVPLERRHAILFAMVKGRHFVSDPERGQQEPHEIAKAIYDYLNGEVEDPDYIAVPLPDSLLMSYLGSQDQPAIPAAQTDLDKGLKRKHDDDEDDEAKRLKTTVELDLSLDNQDPPIPDEVLQMLDAISPGDDVLAARPTTVSIHLVMLELMAQQLTELERQKSSTQLDEASKAVIESQAKQLRSYKRSVDDIYNKHRAALADRQLFEKRMKDAKQKLLEAEKKAARNTEKFEQRIAVLEADKARLLGTKEGEEGEDTPLATNEKLLKEAQEKVKVLEKRLVNAREESEYIRDQYRSAQSAAGETGQLRTQLKKAEEEAGRNKVRIHEINVANSVRGYLSRISELETLLKEREVELDRIREELRVLRNGRRETRQTSVPRSPRMGVLSPRAPARSYPSSTSRGGSPAPVGMDVAHVAGGSLLSGMQFLHQTPANGRWNQPT